jgi:hypothetical protein
MDSRRIIRRIEAATGAGTNRGALPGTATPLLTRAGAARPQCQKAVPQGRGAAHGGELRQAAGVAAQTLTIFGQSEQLLSVGVDQVPKEIVPRCYNSRRPNLMPRYNVGRNLSRIACDSRCRLVQGPLLAVSCVNVSKFGIKWPQVMGKF